MSYWNDRSAFILARHYNLLDETESFYEPWEIEPDDHVMRIAHIASSTNCLIKFDPNELVPPE